MKSSLTISSLLDRTSTSTLLTIALGTCLCYIIGLAVYRLFWHPLAKFPGPKIAALTLLYEFYHDVIRGGQYTWVIKSMHERYGPIVRISPSELHIGDPAFYDKLYTSSTNPREKWATTANLFMISTAFVSQVDSELHRVRRAPFNHLFSKRSVGQLSPVIVKHVQKLCARLAEWHGTGQPVNLRYAYAALAVDVVTDYSFAQPYAALEDPDFAPQWADAVDAILRLVYVNVYFPWLPALLQRMPAWITKLTNPLLLKVADFQSNLERQIVAIMKDPDDEKFQANNHPTVFHELLSSTELPASDRNSTHFMEEALAFVSAGQVTTAAHLTATSFHLLANPEVLRKLKRELCSAMPDAETLLPLEKLEQLEYLSAVVHEGHRVTDGVVHRLQRVSPKLPIVYNGWTIPPGTPVGMTSIMTHDDPETFPSPRTFDPSRFLGEEGQKRKRCLVHFSRGTRSCIGQNLANAELFFALAAVFRRFDLELYHTVRADVDVAADYFAPVPRKGSKGVRVLVKVS